MNVIDNWQIFHAATGTLYSGPFMTFLGPINDAAAVFDATCDADKAASSG
jgi:hypothetical protein